MSVESDFDIRNKLGVDPPCYVRKVESPSHCGNKDDPPELRAAKIKKNVLSEDGGVTSVFYVSSAHDAARAALALNFSRTGGLHVWDLSLIAMKPEELDGVAKEQTTDSLVCHWAQRNHWNVTLQDADQERIANFLATRKRLALRFTKKKMKEAFDEAGNDGCRSVNPDSANCICER